METVKEAIEKLNQRPLYALPPNDAFKKLKETVAETRRQLGVGKKEFKTPRELL